MGFSGGSMGKESACNADDRVQSLEDPLEKEMETHTSILAWEVPCTNVPGGLQSMGLQKTWTRHNNLTASNNNHAVGPWAMSKSSCLSAQAPLGLVGARSRGAPRVVF